MLSPSIVNVVSFFYPIGNTPAVCMTQDLPPEQRADILLLGCGDVRNVLFTVYSGSGINDRSIDFTCCDIERAVIARNVLLFTLLMDDEDGLHKVSIWSIYYHLFLDEQAEGILQRQSKTLCSLATSIERWHNSKYGKVLRFCDSGSLRRARDVWASFDISAMSENAKNAYKQRFKSRIRRAAELGSEAQTSTTEAPSIRTAAPASAAILPDISKLFKYYWDYGITSEGTATLLRPNPMFASEATDTLFLHHSIYPLHGFHVTTAYVPLTGKSPLAVADTTTSQNHKAVEAAKHEFYEWAISFRRSIPRNLTLRFFIGDALGFCNTLSYRKETGSATSAHWYRGMYDMDPLVLDGVDYNRASKAPLTFHVIDTSNLADHVGALNVLAATSLLLEDSPFSTLYMESLLQASTDRTTLLDTLLCGHFPTISILLGLFPIEYWTNASAISPTETWMLDCQSAAIEDQGSVKMQMHSRIAWKRPISSSSDMSQTAQNCCYVETELARILYQVYQQMFQHEKIELLSSDLESSEWRYLLCPPYHRGSFASLLHYIQSRVNTDWRKMMSILLSSITNDSSSLLGKYYSQELYTQLHNFGVYSASTFTKSSISITSGHNFTDGREEKEMAGVISVTLMIPRACLGVFAQLPAEMLRTPIVHCILQSDSTSTQRSWKNIFAMLQLTFGHLKTSGARDTDSFKVEISEDPLGWSGKSPLIASFCAPRWMTLVEPQNTTVVFGVQSTPQNEMTFALWLGPEMEVFQANLEDKNRVYLTKYPPKQSGYPSMRSHGKSNIERSNSINSMVNTTITANVAQHTAKIQTLTGRIDIISEKVKAALKDSAPVNLHQASPCIIEVHIGIDDAPYLLHFPAPVLCSESKTRIARKSSYVEVLAPIASPIGDNSFPRFMYPLFLHGKYPILWNMPYINLDQLPILNTTRTIELEWLAIHATLQMSARELVLSVNSWKPGGKHRKDVRVDFKDSIFAMFIYFSGLKGIKAQVFSLNPANAGGGKVLFFISCLRLDLGNHTVVLDAAVLPLHEQLEPKLKRFLTALGDSGIEIFNINVNDGDLRLWKEVIPTMVERCRQWEHGSSCEYIKLSKIPLSVEQEEASLCSCGNGSLPPNFITGVPEWEIAAKYAVRAAISPSFSVNFVEESISEEDVLDTRHGPSKCWNCGKGKGDDDIAVLLNCSRCQAGKYCSTACQRANWKEHKKICKKGS